MQFGNNIEKMAFEKGEWPMVEISPDGSVIYMGRPTKPDLDIESVGWIIKKIVIQQNIPEPGAQTITTLYAGKEKALDNIALSVWFKRNSYNYYPL